MKKNLINFILLAFFASALISCGNQEQKVNSDGINADKIKVESAIIDEYGKLMPGCKNMITVKVEGIDMAEALIYIDKEAGDAYMEETGVGLAPYDAGKSIDMIVSLNDKGGKKSFDVADKLPDPQIRFFNAETNEIQDYDIENIASVIVEMVGDEKFTELFPEDAQYKILSFDAKLMRGEVVVKDISVKENYDSNQINISTLQDVAKSGDCIVVKVLNAQRKDFEGNWHDVEIPKKAEEIKLKLK